MARMNTAIAGLTAARFAVGVWVATAVPGPLLSADDLAYMSIARTIAGQGAAPLIDQPPYGFLYPILIAPGWLLGFGESSILTWSRIVNALVGALLLPALYLLLRRVMLAGRRMSLLGATIGSLLPAGFLTASIVWAESLLPLLMVLALLALQQLRHDPGRLSITGLVVSSVALYAAHPRMAPVAFVMVLSAVIVLMGRVPRGEISALLGISAVALVTTGWLRGAIQTATFGQSGTYSLTDLVSRRGVTEIPEMAVHAIGAGAYLVLAGAGLSVIGVISLHRSGIVGRVTNVVALTMAVTAGWFLTGIPRADAYLHGRYVEVLAPVLVGAGVVGLTRMRPVVAALVVLVATAAAGFIAAWAGPGDNWANPRSPVMMFGVEVSGAPFGSVIFEPGAAASAALVAGLVVVMTMRNRHLVFAGAAVAMMAAIGVWSGVEGLELLYDGSTAGQVGAELADVSVGRVLLAEENVPNAISGAVAWHFGLDSTTRESDGLVTHLLLPADAAAPQGAMLVADLGSAVLWELR